MRLMRNLIVKNLAVMAMCFFILVLLHAIFISYRSSVNSVIEKSAIKAEANSALPTTAVSVQAKHHIKTAQGNRGEQHNVKFELTKTRPSPKLNEYWSKILHFVPKENNHDCLNLFTKDTSKMLNTTDGFKEEIAGIKEELARLHSILGMTPQHDKLTLTYQELARQDFVHTVCEIGFNAGQSSVAWLTAKPGIMLYSFDIGRVPFTKTLGKWVKKRFPTQFELIIGDSTVTVPKWTRLGKKCDIVSVDGGHEYPTVIRDLFNMRTIAAKEHILVTKVVCVCVLLLL